ncbi:MAG: hypothetical protein E7059_07920, partial [Treponema bryantii]|nr:hypothetical protein [Treponema bryantii]
MKVFELRFKNILIFLFLIFSTPLFSQENESQIKSINLSNGTEEIKLSNQNISWSKVIPGKFICQPQKTSFGFVSITDAKTITAITNEGKLYYENTIPRLANPKLSNLNYDFLLLSSNNNFIHLINPSGKILWTKELDGKIISQAISGEDGRFFLLTKTSVFCFGMNGICKWQINHSLNFSANNANFENQKIYKFSDGSIAISDNKSILRLSPFGKILETKQFSENSSNIFQVSQGKDGIIITNGTKSTFFGIHKDKIFEKWTTEFSLPIEIICNEKNNTIAAFSKNKTSINIYLLNTETGKIRKEIEIINSNFENLQKVEYTDFGLFLFTNKKAIYFTEEGKILWNGNFPTSKKSNLFNYIFLTENNYLVFCKKDWSIDAYRIYQTFESKEDSKQKKDDKKSYESFYSQNTEAFDYIYTSKLDCLITSDQTNTLLSKGFYETKEQDIVSKLLETTNIYLIKIKTSNFGTRQSKSVFESDSKGFNKALRLPSLLGTNTFQDFTSTMIKKEKSTSTISILLNGIKENGYDPNYEILKALEVFSENSKIKNKTL